MGQTHERRLVQRLVDTAGAVSTRAVLGATIILGLVGYPAHAGDPRPVLAIVPTGTSGELMPGGLDATTTAETRFAVRNLSDSDLEVLSAKVVDLIVYPASGSECPDAATADVTTIAPDKAWVKTQTLPSGKTSRAKGWRVGLRMGDPAPGCYGASYAPQLEMRVRGEDGTVVTAVSPAPRQSPTDPAPQTDAAQPAPTATPIDTLWAMCTDPDSWSLDGWRAKALLALFLLPWLLLLLALRRRHHQNDQTDGEHRA